MGSTQFWPLAVTRCSAAAVGMLSMLAGEPAAHTFQVPLPSLSVQHRGTPGRAVKMTQPSATVC